MKGEDPVLSGTVAYNLGSRLLLRRAAPTAVFESLDGAFIRPVQPGFIPHGEGQRFTVVGHRAERFALPYAFIRMLVPGGESFGIVVHLSVIEGVLGDPCASKTPLGKGDLLDETFFEWSFGFELFDTIGEHFVPLLGAFVLEHEHLG